MAPSLDSSVFFASMDYPGITRHIYEQVMAMPQEGEVANYIPELQHVDAKQFGVQLTTVQGQKFGIGHHKVKFSIQSIAKVFSLSLLYNETGEAIWDRVGVEPSGTPFNSLIQLEYDRGIPRNPFINAGALVVSDALIDLFDDSVESVLQFVSQLCGLERVTINEKMANAEMSVAYRNSAVLNLMKGFGNIHHPVEKVLEVYTRVSAIEMTCEELARAFLYLANDGIDPITNKKIIDYDKSQRVNALMLTCGFYDEAGEFAFKVGIPGKSGVGGGIVAIHPDRYALAVWSPKLNNKGNSFKGMKFLELFTSATGNSIF